MYILPIAFGVSRHYDVFGRLIPGVLLSAYHTHPHSLT